MRKLSLVVGALVLGATALPAQTHKVTPELRPYIGALIPTGSQRDLFKDAMLFGAQAALEIRPNFHVLGSFGWVPGRDLYNVTSDKVNLFQYDLGVELSFLRPMGEKWQMRPFVAVGGGARTYDFDAPTLATKTCGLGYAAVGTEFQVGPTALRAEARDNLFCYRSPIAGVESRTRNDIGLALGLSYHFR